MEKTIKELYWYTGNIFEFNNGKKRLVWNGYLIDSEGFIPKCLFNDELVNTDSTVGENVIKIYSPNINAGCFQELIETKNSNLLWKKSEHIYTEQQIRYAMGIPDDEELIIIKSN